MAEVKDAIIQNLIDAGCNEEFISQFKEVYASGQISKMTAMLARQRKSLLDNIHSDEHKIYCLDYLVNRLNKNH